MAVVNTTTGTLNGAYLVSNGGTGIGPISNSNGYNPYSDTVYGVPMHEWQRMSPSDQRYYAERDYMRQQHMKAGLSPEFMETRRVPPPPPLEPTFLTNTKLLLIGV